MVHVQQAFGRNIMAIPIAQIMPTRKIDKSTQGSKKYQTIAASIRELGIIEPLAVHPEPVAADGVPSYILLDGHLRLEALKSLGGTEALCLISTDDEGFTFNRQVGRLTPIQEHRMILVAIKKGIEAARLAEVLGVNVDRIYQRQHLLDGIAPEVVDMLKVKMVSQGVFNVLRKMKPLRQIETVEMMISANCFTHTYAQMVLAATRPEMLIAKKNRYANEVALQDIARMEREMERLYHDYKVVEDTLGETMLVLVVAKGYMTRMLSNEAIAGYLHHSHPELLEELVSIMEAVSSDARHLERE